MLYLHTTAEIENNTIEMQPSFRSTIEDTMNKVIDSADKWVTETIESLVDETLTAEIEDFFMEGFLDELDNVDSEFDFAPEPAYLRLV